jgi:hypothetical protein
MIDDQSPRLTDAEHLRRCLVEQSQRAQSLEWQNRIMVKLSNKMALLTWQERIALARKIDGILEGARHG